MDVEKAASKEHGFFSLFDWGKKSRKRLFSGSSASSQALNGKEADGGTPSTQLDSILEDASSLKESSEHSFSSSVIDDKAHVRRGPTIVARLMGLDSMPVASSSGSYSMPLTMQQPFQNNVHDELIGRSYVGRPHKMPGNPIDRFKIEGVGGGCPGHPSPSIYSPVSNKVVEAGNLYILRACLGLFCSSFSSSAPPTPPWSSSTVEFLEQVVLFGTQPSSSSRNVRFP